MFAVFVRILGTDQSVGVGDTVSFMCEMYGYVHNDSDFLWMMGDEILINDDRASINISDGAPMRGQNGRATPGPSRFSTLTILNIREADRGTYICTVVGTEEEASIQLMVTWLHYRLSAA